MCTTAPVANRLEQPSRGTGAPVGCIGYRRWCLSPPSSPPGRLGATLRWQAQDGRPGRGPGAPAHVADTPDTNASQPPNIALSVLDEHLHAPWKPGGTMSTAYQSRRRRCTDLPNWRLVRYADDFVVLADGTEDHLHGPHEQIAQVAQPSGATVGDPLQGWVAEEGRAPSRSRRPRPCRDVDDSVGPGVSAGK